MMTRWKKLIAILLVLALSLSLTACSGFGSGIAKAAVKMQKLKSFRTDLDMDLGMSLSMFGEALDMDLDLTGTVDWNTSPFKGKADIRVSMEDTAEQLLLYMETEESKLVVYSSADGGKTWSRSEAAASSVPSLNLGKESLAALIQLGKSFEETGTEIVRGSEAVVYSGTVHLAEFITDDTLDSILKAIEEAIEKALDTDIDLSEADLNDLGDVPLTFSIDKKSSMLVKVSTDLTEMVQKLTPVILEQVMKTVVDQSGLGALAGLGGLDLGMLGIDFDIRQLVITMELYDFDAVGVITIPPEVHSA